MIYLVIGKNNTSFLCDKIQEGCVVFENFASNLHPIYAQKLVNNLLTLPLDKYDFYLGTNNHTIQKIFYLLILKGKDIQVSIVDADNNTTINLSKDSDTSLTDFSIQLYKDEIYLSV